MNLSNVFQPTTKLRHVDLESVILGNNTLKFVDGSFLPPFDASGDNKVGPQDPTSYDAAGIEAVDIGLARQIMSGTTSNKYEGHDHALDRFTAVNSKEIRWETPQSGGNVVGAQAFAIGQTLMLQPYVVDSDDNWKLTNVAQGASTTRWHYAKIVAIKGTSTITVEKIEPFSITLA